MGKLREINKGKVERWRTVDGFDKYEISTKGNVRNKKTKRLLKPRMDDCGRLSVQLVSNEGEKVRSKYIHHLQKGITKYVRHKDGDKTNNSIENLEYRPRTGEGITREASGKFSVRIQFIGMRGALYFGTYIMKGSAERVAVCVLRKLSQGTTLKDLLLWANEQKFSRRAFNLEDFDPEDLALYSEF